MSSKNDCEFTYDEEVLPGYRVDKEFIGGLMEELQEFNHNMRAKFESNDLVQVLEGVAVMRLLSVLTQSIGPLATEFLGQGKLLMALAACGKLPALVGLITTDALVSTALDNVPRETH